MKKVLLSSWLPLIAGALVTAAALINPLQSRAETIDIPTLNCGVGSIDNNCLVFDDFTVLSLGLLQEYQSSPFNSYTGLDFEAKPNEGSVFVTRFNGQGTSDQGSGTGIDDPYDALTGNDDNMRFLMASNSLTSGGPSNDIPSDPDGGPAMDNQYSDGSVVNSKTFTDQPTLYPNPQDKYDDPNCYADIGTAGCMPLWDADISELRETIDGNVMAFLFQFNETGDSGELEGQDLLAWARATLTDHDTGDTMEFTLSGNNSLFPFQSVAQETGMDADNDGQFEVGTDILPTADDLWAHVHAEICVEQAPGPTFGAVFLGECSDAGFTSPKTVNQALGADQAGFAIFNMALSNAVLDPNSPWDMLTIDLRHAYLNDGGEQLWIAGANFIQDCPITDPDCVPGVPEPSIIALMALGLSLLALFSWRQRRREVA